MLDLVIRVCSLTFSHPAHKGADRAPPAPSYGVECNVPGAAQTAA